MISMVSLEQGGNPYAIDILSARFVAGRNGARQRLMQQNLSPALISDFAKFVGLSPDCSTIDTVAIESEGTLFNPVSGVMFESRARASILDSIIEKVIHGDDELVVIETDVNGLKGLNDNYGEQEANKAIRAYADGLRSTLEGAIANTGNEIHFAIANKFGGRSDSLKIVLIGKNMYKFTQDYVRSQYEKNFPPVILKTLGDGPEVSVTINGEWGFYVASRKNIETLISDLQNDQEKAGELYTVTSSIAVNKMEAEKVRSEASLINEALDAPNLQALNLLWDKVETFGPRIPVVVIKVLNRLRKKLEFIESQKNV